MTIGETIKALRQIHPDLAIEWATDELYSYRGYYEDLAINPAGSTTVGALLAALEGAVGDTFEGYKGGEYVMRENTRVWLARFDEYGAHMLTGVALTGNGVALLGRREDD